MNKENYSIGDNDKNNQANDALDMTAGMGSIEKAKDAKKMLKDMFLYSKKHIPIIIIAVIFSIIGAVLALVGPDKLSELTDLLTDGLLKGINLNSIAEIGVILIFIYASSGIFSFLQGYIMATVSQKISKQMRTDISTKINRLPMWFYNKNTTGDILSRITNDVDSLGQNLNQSVTMAISSIALFIGAVVMMFITNWIMAITAIIASLVGFSSMMLIMSKSQKYFDKQQEYLGKINGHVEETFSGHTVVKAYNAQGNMRKVFVGINNDLKKSNFMSQFLSGLMIPIMTFVDNLGYVAVTVVGATLALNGNISFGVIVAFLVYVRYLTQPLTQIAQSAQGIQIAIAAGERVFEFLQAEEMSDESNKTKKIETPKGRVDFKNVKFGYEDSDKIIINNFSATALPGQKVAIVGPTGAGKTTLVNLLMRFNDLKGGEIFIDNIPISDMTRQQIRSLFCMVLQDTWLFEGTIKENIIYSKAGVTDEQVESACKAVGLHHFIKTLTHGYNTILDDKANLSIGQKQQITIARAMIEDAPMLILDEATSSVDTRTELHIQQAMDKLMENRTSFVIAHRLSTIKNADIILVLKDGDIIESGNHQQLLSQNGFYAELYNSQFEVA